MTRCYIEKRDGYQNIPADRIEESGDYFIVMRGEKVVGVFDKGVVMSIVLTEKREEKR
jgi:hypothetical protein